MEDFVTGLLIVVLIMCAAFFAGGIVAQLEKEDTCRAAGYVWSKAYAGTAYCIRIEDECLIGVPLTTLE